MSSAINGFILFSLVITALFFVGLINLINDHRQNECEMTYMFQYPQFVRISQEIDDKYPQYGLYAYSEGSLTSRSRNMDFDGIPVLFIPGNAGSHRQARSFASIALRKWLNSRTPFHFDHFSLDLNNEYSGLNGALLYQQLEYANYSVYRILELYKGHKNGPNYILLYAHSVGGIIARHLVNSLPPDSNLIPIVLTLASPHQRPPLILDSYIYDFYMALNSTEKTKTTFISISGGFSDLLVSTFLTKSANSDTLNLVTTQIPRSWVAADHVCIVWCKQTILALNRAFFDCVDPKTRHINMNEKFRRSVFHHHLVHHNGLGAFLPDNYANTTTNVRNHGQWIEPLGRQFTVKVPEHSGPHFYMIKLMHQPLHEALTVVAQDLETVEWVFVCTAYIPREKGRVCDEFTPLSHLSEISPSNFTKRRSFRVNLHQLLSNNPDWTHVVVRTLPSDDVSTLNFDVYRVSDRKITVTLPHMLSIKPQIIIGETQEKAIHYELVVANLSHVIQSYELSVDVLKCDTDRRHATASLIVPWGFRNQHKYFTQEDSGPMTVRLHESRPQWASRQAAVIQLTLDPNCRYKISIKSSFPGILNQMTRFYSPLLLANVAVVVLMTLNSQLNNIGKNRACSIFFVAMQEGAKPYYVLTSVKLLSRVLSAKQFVGYLPPPDWLTMFEEGIDFFLLPLILYVCSVGITWLLGVFLAVGLVVFETTLHKLVLKFLAKTVSFTFTWSDYVMAALHKVPCVVSAALVCLSLTTTGSLALCVGTVFYFMRLTQLSQDYVEELVWHYVQTLRRRLRPTNNNNEEKQAHNAMFFHCTIFMLWCLLTLINIPSVLTWAHNYKFSTALNPDPSFIPGLILSVCALPLWQLDMPKIERKFYTQVGQFMIVLGVVSLIYAPISVFRLNYTLATAIVVVTLHQLVAPNRDLAAESAEDRPPGRVTYEMIKAKFE